ncbi:MAG TPA: DUF1285 domain-containing protein [Myxococcota bacterium]|nr:DUF1285 domain-containing protein [Myxococcota bacterium]HRY95521.1 DUF1285 domain-containing protein [Myxococcota bacterium]HSA19923.1 DUF1285 domain-containing protein [Myxococcota bacterium]
MRVQSAEQSGLVLDAAGRWFHRGEPVANPRVAEFFHRAIRRDGRGDAYLANLVDGEEERVYFRAEDTLFFVRRLRLAAPAPAEARLLAALSAGAEVELAPEGFSQGAGGVLYARLPDGQLARLTSQAACDLGEWLREEDGQVWLVLGARRCPLGREPARPG